MATILLVKYAAEKLIFEAPGRIPDLLARSALISSRIGVRQNKRSRRSASGIRSRPPKPIARYIAKGCINIIIPESSRKSGEATTIRARYCSGII
jgi:hypothetical protein